MLRFLVGAVAIFLAAAPCVALDYTPIQVDSGTFLVVAGEFQPDEDLSRFAAAVTSSGATTVGFNSPGGSVDAAIRLGKLIRLMGLGTLQLRQMECASACSLAFVGGVRRFAEPGSIGVHRSSFASGNSKTQDQAVEDIQKNTADILAHLREMGVKQELLEFALSYSKDDMRYLSASEMSHLKVTTDQADVPGSITSRPQYTSPPSTPEASAPAQSDELERAALTFIRELVEQHGNDPGRALARVVTSYAGTVSYYGKPTPLADVVADKQKYFQRWPERGYSIRNETVMVTCANDNCMVSGIYDWVVRSIPRNKQAKGKARFSYTILLGENPKIVAESGETIR